MGKKRAFVADGAPGAAGGQKSQWWCYYCGADCKDEESLVRHQQSKHFRCPHCDASSPFRFCQSVSGLVAHVRRSHKMELTKVPGAMEGREDVNVDIFGMFGIPEAALLKDTAPSQAPQPAAALTAPAAGVLGAAIAGPHPATPESMVAVLEVYKAAEAKRQKEAAEAAQAAQAAALLAAAVGAASGPAVSSMAVAALGAIGPLGGGVDALGGTGVAGAPSAPTLSPLPAWPAESVFPPPAPAPAVPAAPPIDATKTVWGKWRHSAGGEVTVTPGMNGSVIVSHAAIGELTVRAADFMQGSTIRFVQREGALEGNVIRWSNGTSWIKVL